MLRREPVPKQAAAERPPPFKAPPIRFRGSRHTAVVKEVFDIAKPYPETYLIRFTFEDIPRTFDYQAGQFISIFAEKDGKSISRPYSIASPPEQKDHLELCIKVVEGGFMSNYLHHVAPGTKLKAIAPLGTFVLLEPPDYPIRDTVFVATGTGVAPFIGMIGHIWAMDYDIDVHLVFGCRYKHDLIYMDVLEKWEREHPNFHLYVTLSRPENSGWKGRNGYVQKVLENEIKDPQQKDMYICGLHNMVEDVTKLCQELNFHWVRFEKWD
ncbi:MAG: FAD-dependent oxidoreductase [Methanobacteriota archaeon]|nr:MAG: FAD-dependent oxidoreductase [Euryarchaeota archaeon]